MGKILGVGMHKTGTSSLGTALRILGFRTTGWSLETASIYKRGHKDALIDMMQDFGGFEDVPWFLLYKEACARYPDTKLVLTKRIDMEVWFTSLSKHIDRSPPDAFSFRETIYGTNDLLRIKSHVIETHRKHISDVREFARRNGVPLLEVCWEEGHGWEELCSFIGVDEPEVKFPHSNAAPGSNLASLKTLSHSFLKQLRH